MGAMTQQSGQCNEYGKNRDCEGHGQYEWIVAVIITMFGKFDAFSHSAGFSFEIYGVSRATRCKHCRAASTARSMSASECAAETKAASNWDGAKNIPRSSISRKYRA